MFRSHFQQSAHVMLGQLFYIFRTATSQIHTNATGDQHLPNAFDLTSLTHQLNQRSMVGTQQLANLRMHTRLPSTLGFNFWLATVQLVHVRSRPADVADHASELWIVRHLFDLADDRVLRSRLDDSALMSRDGTESTTAKASTHNRDRILDRRERWNRLLVARVRLAGVR